MAIPRPYCAIIIGQSYGEVGYFANPGYVAFAEAVRRSIDSAPATVQATIGTTVSAGDLMQLYNNAYGGSSVLAANAGSAGNYWVENDQSTAGPRLTTTLSDIAGYSGLIRTILYSHGEQEAGMLASEAASFDAKAAILDAIFPQVRLAINASNPNGMPIWVDMLGPRYPSGELGEYWMRDRLIEIVEAGTRVYMGAEKYAVQLDGTTHPTPLGYRQIGAHVGRKAAAWLLDPTNADVRGPQITNPVRSGSDVTVTISVPSGETLEKPSSPDFFGLFDASDGRIDIDGFTWSGNDLTIHGAQTPAKLRYPCPTGENLVDISKIIRLSDPADPVYVGEPGLPLESMLTHTF